MREAFKSVKCEKPNNSLCCNTFMGKAKENRPNSFKKMHKKTSPVLRDGISEPNRSMDDLSNEFTALKYDYSGWA